MLGDNIKKLRKQKGLTQEDLATELHIVRQTISKWEKNLSVPDADLLEKIALVLETDVQYLLKSPNSELDDYAETTDTVDSKNVLAIQLSKLNEQLATKARFNRKIWKIVGITLISIIVLLLLWYTFGKTISINVSSSDVFTKELSL